MNQHEQSPRPLDPVVLDRLVDGELPEAQRRELLTSLEQQPEGWRRCALAFLEAQSWGQSLGEWVRTPAQSAQLASAAPAPPQPAAVARPAASWGSWKSLLAMAASFLITFTLGMGLQRMWNNQASTRGPAPAGPTSPDAVAAVPNPGTNPASDVQTVQVAVDGMNGQPQTFNVPLVDVSQAPQALFQQHQPVVPDNIRRALEQSGRQVRQQRQYYPVTLPDGRQVIVPVDQVEVVPVGGRGVQ